MFEQTNWRKTAPTLIAVLLVLLFSLSPLPQLKRESWNGSWFSYREALAARGKRAKKPESEKVSTSDGKLTEVAPPATIQELQRSLDDNKPQVFILSPRPNEVLSNDTVAVQFQVRDLPIFKDKATGLGPHLHVFLDNQTYQAVYDTSKPLVFANLAPGTHTIRVFASRPWHESFKNEGAYDQATFHVFTKTQENNPNPDLPLLTYSRPQGIYGAEPILLDFYLNNAPLHLVAQDDQEVADWQIRCTVNGHSFVVDNWQPIYLKGFKPGKNWVQLEFLDEAGKPVNNVYNSTARVIQYEPGGSDTLSKLVRGDLTAAAAQSLIDPNYKPPVPQPTPVPSIAPSSEPAKDAIAKPSPVLIPLPTPVAPEPETSELKAPKVKNSELKPPEVKAPEVKAPELKTSEPKAPKVKTPEPKVSPSPSIPAVPVAKPTVPATDASPTVGKDPQPEAKADFAKEMNRLPDPMHDREPTETKKKPTAKDAIDNFLNQFRPQRSPKKTLVPEPAPSISPLLEPILEPIQSPDLKEVEPVLVAPKPIEPVKIKDLPRAIAPAASNQIPAQPSAPAPAKPELPPVVQSPVVVKPSPSEAIAPPPQQPLPSAPSPQPVPSPAASINLLPVSPQAGATSSVSQSPGASRTLGDSSVDQAKATVTRKAAELKSQFSTQFNKLQEQFRRPANQPDRATKVDKISLPSNPTEPAPAVSSPVQPSELLETKSRPIPANQFYDRLEKAATNPPVSIPKSLESPVLESPVLDK